MVLMPQVALLMSVAVITQANNLASLVSVQGSQGTTLLKV